jgi:hypothetical protein
VQHWPHSVHEKFNPSEYHALSGSKASLWVIGLLVFGLDDLTDSSYDKKNEEYRAHNAHYRRLKLDIH